MLKDKKGFTLVELIATIGILVLMSTIIGVNIVSILRSTDELNENNDKAAIEAATCVYIDSSLAGAKKGCYINSPCSINVSEVIISGLLSDAYSADYSTKSVKITNEDGKKCILQQ